MKMHEELLEFIRAQPGTSRMHLCQRFRVSRYRIHRVLRQIDQDLQSETVVWGDGRGVWVVDLKEGLCRGMTWLGPEDGGFCQCSNEAVFADGRCWEHSECSNPELVYFMRRLATEAGPTEPSVFVLSQLSRVILKELDELLASISPWTKRDRDEKQRLGAMVRRSLAFIRWRDLMRDRRAEGWIPPEFEGRHRASSVNPFEFSIKKYFSVLEVTPEATRAEVVEAWKRLARKFHPDTGDGDEDRMKAINIAKERIFRIRRWD